MNKYQEALDYAKKHLDSKQDLEKVGVLQELVDKETPEKPQKAYVVDGTYYICPCCGHIIEDYSNMQDKDLKKYVIKIVQYCESCGAKLDWSDE